MKLAISNIAWEPQDLDEHLKLVRRLGCHGIELASSCVWPEPVATTTQERRAFKNKLNSFDLEIIGLHALLFTRPDLTLFTTPESRKATGEYLKKHFELASDLGARVLTFGSPRNRSVAGRDYQECLAIATDFFRELMPAAAQNNVVLCLEFLSTKECDFITSSHEAFALVQAVGSAHFGLHLDIKALIDAGEDYQEVFRKYAGLTQHMHVGDPGLSPPGTTGVDHRLIGKALQASGYQRYLSIEMRRGFGPTPEVVEKSIQYVKDCYFIGDPS